MGNPLLRSDGIGDSRVQENFPDAAHTNPVAGAQTEWLKSDLAARKSKQFVFAAYPFSDYGTTKAAKEGTTLGEWKRGRCRAGAGEG